MSRPLRLEFSGAIWHVTSRGNERREIFHDDSDCARFLEILGRTADLYRWRVHAYVLMGNHYHLLVETPEPTLSRGMRQLNGVYTQTFNRRRGRVGHLFQGRFKAILVERDSHLLELARYIVLNPVRAGVTKRAGEWPWSSYRATAGVVAAPGWLATEWTLGQFGRRRVEALGRYREFVSEGRGAGYEPWKQVQAQIYLGSDEFLDEAERRADGISVGRGIPRSQLRPRARDARELFGLCAEVFGRTPEDLLRRTRLLAAERKAVAWALRRYGLLGHRLIGEILGVGEAQASTLVAGAEEALGADPGLRRKLQKVLKGMSSE